MDPPYEQARSTTALRLIDIAVSRGYEVNVFAYEGAVALTSPNQRAHANGVHKREVEEEDHPLPHRWIEALRGCAQRGSPRLGQLWPCAAMRFDPARAPRAAAVRATGLGRIMNDAG